MSMVRNAQSAADQARKAQVAAWQRWQASDSAEDMAAWAAAVDAQRKAEDAVETAKDRAEAWADRREAWMESQRDRQSDWWVAAKQNARA